jgi:hypothetical protein
MRFKGTADPEQLAIMTKAFDDYCLARNITADAERDYAAHLIMWLFIDGAKSADEIRARLDREGRIQQDNFADG